MSDKHASPGEVFVAQSLTTILFAAALSLPAIYNGYPLLFSDSGEYYARSASLVSPEYRTIGYSLFLRAVCAVSSLWPSVVAQCLLVAALVSLVVRVTAPSLRLREIAFGALVLVAATPLPWVTSQIMPDVFASVAVLAMALVVTHWQSLGLPARVFAAASLVISVISHMTHLAVAASVLLAWVFSRSLGGDRNTTVGRGALRGGLAIGTAILALVTANWLSTGRLFLSPNGHVFVLGRLVEVGLVKRLLDEDCPAAPERFALCRYRDELPATAAEFIWSRDDNLLAKIGGRTGSRAEAELIIEETLRRYPGRHLVLAVRSTAEQLASIWTLDGLSSYAGVPWVERPVRTLTGEESAFLAARQQTSTLDAEGLAHVHRAIAYAAMLASLLVLVRSWIRRQPVAPGSAVELLLLVWTSLVVNAFVCATFAGVYPRYQTRLAWLPVLALLLVVRAEWKRRADSRSGARSPD